VKAFQFSAVKRRFKFSQVRTETRLMIPLFRQAGLTKEALARLDDWLIERELRAGETLVVSGEYADSVYFVLEGAIDVFTSENEQVASLTANDSFGEKALLEPGPATHTLRATTTARVKTLDGTGYDQFAKEFPESAFALQAVIARRVLQELKKAQSHLRLLFETFKAS
jgi:CRP-like cAMP-binding protein